MMAHGWSLLFNWLIFLFIVLWVLDRFWQFFGDNKRRGGMPDLHTKSLDNTIFLEGFRPGEDVEVICPQPHHCALSGVWTHALVLSIDNECCQIVVVSIDGHGVKGWLASHMRHPLAIQEQDDLEYGR